MRKKGLCAILIGLVILTLCPIQAFAAEKISVEREVELTVSYQDDEKPITKAQFDVYQVAATDEYAKLTLTADFAPYEYSVSGLSNLNAVEGDQWMELATTLKGYALRDGLKPVASKKTDAAGTAVFTLQPGLYMVVGQKVICGEYRYSALPAMIFLPGSDEVNNGWDYKVTAYPKHEKECVPPDDQTTSVKVLKAWDDQGYETLRPTEVVMQLLQDGELFDEKTLSKDNNWRYTWTDLEASHEWMVVEKAQDNYVASITSLGGVITVSNRYAPPSCVGNPGVQKRITGDTPEEDSAFTFILTAKDKSCPMPQGSNGTTKEIRIVGAGSEKFGEIVFTKPGVYAYTVREKNTGVAGYTYDTTVYSLTYGVLEKDGKQTISETIKNDKGQIVSTIEFTNDYNPPGTRVPQTGMLWWPVPVMLCLGIACITVGVARRRRSK
ncbi:MAG: Cna B-type domain-containing protein [Clostridiales bacterium]|nr:Cna B-type domain-containing protein [Candidatus Cacconaster stercorequi]